MTRGDRRLVGDHGHVAVAEPSQLIVEHAVPQAVTDQPQLVPMAARALQPVGAATRAVVADMGDDDGADVQQGAAQGWTVYSPKPPTSATTTRGLVGKARCPDQPAPAV